MPSGIDTMEIVVQKDSFIDKEQKVLAELHRAVDPDAIELESDIALIAVVGRGMKNNSGIAGQILGALANAGINIKMIDQGSSELNIIIGVRNKYFEGAIKAIYELFIKR
jgi:aspartate kinase